MDDRTLKKEGGMLEWLAKWDKAMAEGIIRKVPETLQPSAWLMDFLRVTIRHLSDGSRSYRLAKETSILEGSVTFRTVSGDAAKEVRFFPQAGPLRISGKGAFQADKAPVKHKNTVDNGAHQDLEMEADTLQDPEFDGKASSRSSTRGRRRDRGRD